MFMVIVFYISYKQSQRCENEITHKIIPCSLQRAGANTRTRAPKLNESERKSQCHKHFVVCVQ